MCAQKYPLTDREQARTRIGRRRLLIAGGTGMALMAGCTGSENELTDDSADDGGETEATGTFRLLVSDRPVAIDHFDSLEVTFDEARVFQSDGTDDEETEGDDEDEENGTEADEEEDDGEEEEDVDAGEEEDNGEEEEDVDEDEEEDDEEGEVEDEADDEDDDEAGDDEQNGFFILDLDSPTVDLTEVVGAKAINVFEDELEVGRYTKIELSVDEIEGILADDVDSEQDPEDGEADENGGAEENGDGSGDADDNGQDENQDGDGAGDENGQAGEEDDTGTLADVKVPSEKLQIVKPFEVTEGGELSFVFDINVVQRGQGNGYNLLPVIGESGVDGEDVEVEEVEEEDDDAEEEDSDTSE